MEEKILQVEQDFIRQTSLIETTQQLEALKVEIDER